MLVPPFGGKVLGACWVPLPRHAANIDEIMEVRWSDYYGAALFGDEDEIACLPRNGCRLEIVVTVESSHHDVNLLVPGHVLHYQRAFCFPDRFELPNGTRVGLWHLVGFKLRLVSDTIAPVPRGRTRSWIGCEPLGGYDEERGPRRPAGSRIRQSMQTPA